MSRSPSRPVLLPGLRRLWRDPYRLQLGTDPRRAVVLELTDPTAARMLDLLDGTRTSAAVLRDATARQIATDEAQRILAVLAAAGLVVDARAIRPPDASPPAGRRLDAEAVALAYEGTPPGLTPAGVLRRRLAARVLITGAGGLGVTIGCALAAAGVGHLDLDLSGVAGTADILPGGLTPNDAHRPRRAAAADAVRRAAPGVRVGPLRPEATFAVLVGFAAPVALTALSCDARRLAHLAVCVRDSTVVVGPLVRPGQTPCLNCVDLHRRDRDPSWPTIAAQLQTGPDPLPAVATTTALSAAAYAAAEVLAHLDGQSPRTLGATVEISKAGAWIRRQWSRHPSCGCWPRPRRHRSSLGRPTQPGSGA